MKRIFLFSCSALLSLSMYAQTKTPHVKPQSQTKTPPSANPSNNAIRERLVELALDNPQMRIAGYQKDKTNYEVTKASASWLNYVTASMNINEVTTGAYKANNPDRANIYYPLWNIGINVPLGSLISKPADVKIARKNRAIATEEKEVLARLIKRQILSLYEDYLNKADLLNIQTEMAEDEAANLQTVEEKFSSGGVGYQEYSTASKSYSEQLFKQKVLQRDLNVVKLQIEEIIGVRLEEVLLQK
ncbi:TolC family protein [Chitinophaga flava]|uniref:Outer membrane efflux protein n=1 Tax=Chitinophaga flava TaxID=2259036 RepID=A0A365XPF0_9BACT|nr:TolC family protein [Chitinophaga flava]RBL88020.1 hypothetical protein DF182_31280 [Chitinophaga flava]